MRQKLLVNSESLGIDRAMLKESANAQIRLDI